jgi:hypothetical protein
MNLDHAFTMMAIRKMLVSKYYFGGAIGTSSSSGCSTTTSAIELLLHLSRSVPAAATRPALLFCWSRSVPAALVVAVLPPAPSNYYCICRDRYQQLQRDPHYYFAGRDRYQQL